METIGTRRRSDPKGWDGVSTAQGLGKDICKPIPTPHARDWANDGAGTYQRTRMGKARPESPCHGEPADG